MLKTLKIFLVLILLIPLGKQNCLAFEKAPSSTVSLGARELGPQVKFVEQNNVLYINHLLLEAIFNTEIESKISKSLIKINFANFKIEFHADPSLLILNGKQYEITNLPFEQGDNLWLPLEFYEKLGIVQFSRNRQQLRLTWGESYLLNLDFIQFQGRPALELILTGIAEFNNYLLTKPDRLVCQLPAAKIHPANLTKTTKLRNSLIKKTRFSEDDTGHLILAFELTKSTGYQVIHDSAFPERFLIVFNYSLEDVSLFRKGGETKVNIKTSSPADFKVVNKSSQRLIIHFYNATLKNRSKTISGDGDLIKELLVEQINPDAVQISITLLKAEELFVVQSLANPNLIQIRKVQLITGLAWTSSTQGSQLAITGDGELLAKVHKVNNAKGLQLDLNYTQFQTGLTTPDLSGDQGKAIRLNTLNSNQVRLEIDLNYLLSYTIETSPDHRQLRISFQHSPLVNKTFVIDPGHGGPDNGAIGKLGTLEKEINLEVSLRLKDHLEAAGANVVLTRFEDTFISLYERAFLANFLMADFFISIHTNSHPKPLLSGIEVFYYPSHLQAKPMATKILDALVQQTGLKKLAVKTNNFAVIRETQMTGVLLELGFLSNLQEERLIRLDQFKVNAAQGAFQGIIDLYEQQY